MRKKVHTNLNIVPCMYMYEERQILANQRVHMSYYDYHITQTFIYHDKQEEDRIINSIAGIHTHVYMHGRGRQILGEMR